MDPTVEDALLAHADGAATVQQRDIATKALASDAEAQQFYHRAQALQRHMRAAGPPAFAADPQFTERVTAGTHGGHGMLALGRRYRFTFSALAVAALVLVVTTYIVQPGVRQMQDGTVQSRGSKGSQAANLLGFEAYVHRGNAVDQPILLLAKSVVRNGDKLTFVAINRGVADAYMALYMVDAEGTLVWLFPAASEGESARALSMAGFGGGHQLPQGVTLDGLGAGPLTLAAIFLDSAVRVGDLPLGSVQSAPHVLSMQTLLLEVAAASAP